MYNSAEEIETLAKEIMEITESINIDEIRTYIVNTEGRTSKVYWGAVSKLFPDRLKFPGRRSRGAIDPINMILNFGYKAILFVETWKAIYYSRLDPYAGYLHADKPGKPLLFWIL